MHGFTRLNVLGSIARDVQASTPPAIETNLVASDRDGIQITANSTIHTKATSYTEIIASSVSICYGIWITIFDVGTNATATGMLIDIATGAASSESIIIPDINAGYAFPSASGIGKTFYFGGFSIPAGTRFSARSQALISSDTANVCLLLESRSQWHIANSAWIAYGVDSANSRGTSVTPANGTFGTWTSIATTSRNHNLFTVGLDGLSTNALSGGAGLLEIGYGPDASNVTSIALFHFSETTAELISGTFPSHAAFVLASGNPLWCRMSCGHVQARGVIIYGN